MKEQSGFISERKQPRTDEQPGLLSFGNYDLVRRIDVGGMGEVYLARQRTAFGREVAVKIIRPDLVNDAVARQRFLREAEVGSYLKHDHILPLLEFGEEQGRLFIVTPYIAGGTLAQRIERGPLSLAEVHELFSALVRAVAYLHKRNIVHRDLKPGNILLDKEEDSDRIYVRLIDFGIATAQGLPSSASLTAAEGEFGTAAYMAPERKRGVSAPSNDIYSLGVILYLMLTGSLPGYAEDIQGLPPSLLEVIKRSIAPDPAQRYATADELTRAFEHACRTLSSPQLPFFPQQRTSENITATTSPDSNAETVRFTQEQAPVDPPARLVRPPYTSPPSRLPLRARPQSQEQVVISPLERLQQRRASGEYPPIDASDAGSLPGGNSDPGKLSGTEKEYVVFDRRSSTNPLLPTAMNSQPQAGTVLPSLPDNAKRRFHRDDYDAPTSMIDYDDEEEPDTASEPKQKRSFRQGAGLKSGAVVGSSRAGNNTQARRGSPFLLVGGAIVVLLLILGSVGYFAFISAVTANVTIGPHVQTVSAVFTVTASLDTKAVDVGKGMIPASVLTSTQTGSLQGRPTGVSGCILGIFECKETVSLNDISNLSAQLRPGLKSTLAANIQKQTRTMGITTIGDIVYTDGNVTSNPPEGAHSHTMTVTMTEQGSIEYIRSQDVQKLALALLQKKVPARYSLIDTMTRVGQPVIRTIGANGEVTIAIAAASVASYEISQDDLTAIQNHIKGLSVKDARAYVVTNPNLDPALASVSVSYGESVPGSTGQIKIKQLQPTNIPTVQLPAVPQS
jgi:serine/threonine protein kinase